MFDMDEMSAADRQRIRSRLSTVYRFIIAVLAIIAVPQLLNIIPRVLEYWNQDNEAQLYLMTNLVSVFMVIPTMFSIVKLSSASNAELFDSFSKADSPDRFFRKLRFLFREKLFWIKAVAFAAIYLIFPTKLLFSNFADLLLLGNSMHSKMRALLILLPSFFIIYVWANVSALTKFEIDGRCRTFEGTWAYFKAVFRKFRNFLAWGVSLHILIPLFFVAVVLILNAHSAKFFIILGLAIVVPWVLLMIRALLKRRKFLKRLYAVCAEKKYTLSNIRLRYISAIFPCYDESFTVNTGEKTYSCKLVSSVNPLVPLVITDSADFHYIYLLKIRKIVLFEFSSFYRFGYESENQKIYILNPTAKKINVSHGGKRVGFDNGDTITDGKIYATSAFLNALERDCLDK